MSLCWASVEMSDNLNTIFDAVLQAAYRLFSFAMAYFAYRCGRIVPEHFKSKLKCFAIILGIAALFGFMSYSDLGSYVEDGDPLFGGGEVIQEYEPTNAERLESGVKIFVILGALLTLGALYGFQDRRNESKG